MLTPLLFILRAAPCSAQSEPCPPLPLPIIAALPAQVLHNDLHSSNFGRWSVGHLAASVPHELTTCCIIKLFVQHCAGVIVESYLRFFVITVNINTNNLLSVALIKVQFN